MKRNHHADRTCATCRWCKSWKNPFRGNHEYRCLYEPPKWFVVSGRIKQPDEQLRVNPCDFCHCYEPRTAANDAVRKD